MGFGFNKKLQIVKYKLCTNIYCELKITRDIPKQLLFQCCSVFILATGKSALCSATFFIPCMKCFLSLTRLLLYLWQSILCTCLPLNKDLKYLRTAKQIVSGSQKRKKKLSRNCVKTLQDPNLEFLLVNEGVLGGFVWGVFFFVWGFFFGQFLFLSIE